MNLRKIMYTRNKNEIYELDLYEYFSKPIIF